MSLKLCMLIIYIIFNSENGCCDEMLINQTESVPTPPLPPPFEFPKNATSYNIVENSTLLAKLQPNEGDRVNEVDDLVHSELSANHTVMELASRVFTDNAFQTIHQHFNTKDIDVGGGGSDDTEPIQVGHNEDTKFIAQFHHDEHGQVIMQGQMAAVLAGIFVIVAVIGYVALLSWRRFLENRYGNREMLCNEEDMNDPNDLRHFTL